MIPVAMASATVAAEDHLPPKPALPPWTWEASKPGQAPIWLVGVLHLGTKLDEPFFPSYLDVYHRASSVYLELYPGADSSFDGQRLVGMLGRSRDRMPLRTRIPRETWRELKIAFSSRPDDLQNLDTSDPWLAALVVTEMCYAEAGLDAHYSLEEFILDQASEDHKPVGCLETQAQEVSALADAPLSAQVNMLEAAIKQPTGAPLALDEAWRAGKTSTLIALLATGKSVDLREIDARVIEQRNLRWMKEINNLSSRGQQALLLVGVEHLVDAKFGLLRLLKQNGYTLNPEPPGI